MRRYLWFVLPALGLMIVVGGFLIANLQDDLVYYQTPTEALERRSELDASRFRLGGQVIPGSIVTESDTVAFGITDGFRRVDVIHRGAPQQLFQEGIGVVVEGAWDGDVFRSDTMIVKHDEQYRTEDGGVYTPENPPAP